MSSVVHSDCLMLTVARSAKVDELANNEVRERLSEVSHRPSMPPPPRMVDFSTPTSPMMAPMRLEMHDRNGIRVDSSDEDRNDNSIRKNVLTALSANMSFFLFFGTIPFLAICLQLYL
jgi:hypothetical protein